MGSYEAADNAKPQSVSTNYDPVQIFQYPQPGGCKITKGALNPNVL
jgi:hypothetical protein